MPRYYFHIKDGRTSCIGLLHAGLLGCPEAQSLGVRLHGT